LNIGIDRRMLIVIMAVVAVLSIMSDGTPGIMNTLLIIPAVLIAITFHEFAHAFAAVKLGDDTPKNQGRLNLNPINHLDPVGTLLLLVAGFGWGRPVEINPSNFDKKISMSKAEAIVSIAGPLMNFFLAFIFLIIYYAIFIVTDVTAGLSTELAKYFEIAAFYIVTINIGLGIFNLIPLPPLDGSKIMVHFLPYNGKQWFYNNIQIFSILFLIIWISGLSRTILSPIFLAVFKGMDWVVASLFGLFM